MDEPSAPRTPRLLLVDDLPANLSVLCGMLEHEGYHLSVAMSGAEALELAAQATPDVVLLDVTMPGMDGYEACRRLHAREEEVLARVHTHLRLYELTCCLSAQNHLLAERNAPLEAEIAQRKRLRGHLSLISPQEAQRWGLERFVGSSPTLRRIFDEIRLMQENAGTSVLICGEGGTGKELIARAIHFGGRGASGRSCR